MRTSPGQTCAAAARKSSASYPFSFAAMKPAARTTSGRRSSWSRRAWSNSRPDWYGANASCRYVGAVSVSQPTTIASGCSACHSVASQFVNPVTALLAIVFGPPW